MEFQRKITGAWRRARSACVAFLRRRNPAEYFIALAVIGLLVYTIRCLVGGTAAFLDIFFMRGDDILPDFFNPLRDAAQGIATYTERHVMYPPLGNLLLRLLGRLLPAAYLNTSDADFHTWNAYSATMLAYLLFAVLILAWIAARLSRENHPAPRRAGLIFFLLCSFPFLFWLERGNTVLFIVPLLLIFAQNYDSESPFAREAGLLALAVAFALKLYPALFGAVLVADRRWREAVRCAVYAVILLIAPSFAYGGPRALWYVVQNIARFSHSRSGNARSFLGNFGISSTATALLLMLMFLLLAVFLVAYACVCRKRSHTLAIAATIMLCIPSVFSSYNMMMMLIPLVLFLRQEKLQTPRDFLWFAGLSLPFVAYLPHPASDNLNIVCMAAMYVAAVWELIETLVLRRRARKQAQADKPTQEPASTAEPVPICAAHGKATIAVCEQKQSSVATVWQNFVKALRQRDLIALFMAAFALCWLILLLFVVFGGHLYFYNLFFRDTQDAFMDFFNSVRDAHLFAGVYTERGVIYPPLANLIYLIFSRVMPAGYVATSFDDRYEWPHYPGVIAADIVYLALIALVMALLYRRLFAGRGKRLMVFGCFAVLCNMATLYGMERGNIVIISSAAAGFYLITFDSESKKLREAGLVALAFATALKLYPIVFAWMLLSEKRYREIGRLVLYTALLFIVPSFFFGGPVCFVWMVLNAIVFFASRSGIGGAGVYQTVLYAVITVLFWACVAAAPFVPFVIKDRWRVFVYFGVTLAAALPLQSVYGCSVLFTPMWMGIFAEKKLTLKNARYFVPMALLFLPLVNPVRGQRGMNNILLPYLLLILLVVCLTDFLIALIRRWRERKKADIPAGEA